MPFGTARPVPPTVEDAALESRVHRAERNGLYHASGCTGILVEETACSEVLFRSHSKNGTTLAQGNGPANIAREPRPCYWRLDYQPAPKHGMLASKPFDQ